MGEVLRAIIETMFKGYDAAAIYFQKEGKPKIRKYFKALLLLLGLTFFPSLPLIYYGIFYDSSWALVAGGVWRAVCTLLLMIAATPIGLIYESATGGIAGSGRRYVKLVSGVFISELLFVLIVSLIPIANNPKMFPIFTLAALILGFSGAVSMNRTFVGILVGIAFVGIVISFFVPHTVKEMKNVIRNYDLEAGKPEFLTHTLDDYKTGKVEFFYANGDPKVWYVEVDDKIELLSKAGFHTGIGVDASPINKSVIDRLRKAKWENLSPNNVIPEKASVAQQMHESILTAPSSDSTPAVVEQQMPALPPPPPEPPKEPDYYVLKPTGCSGGYGVTLHVHSGEINPAEGTIKIVFLQQTPEGYDYYAILSPNFNTYVTDENGLRYKYLDMDGMASMDVPDKSGRFTKLVRNVPHRYTVTFKLHDRRPNKLHYTSTFYIPDALGMFFRQQTVTCSSIDVIPEFR